MRFIIMVFSFILFLNANGDLHIYSVDNSGKKITPKTIQTVLEKNGIVVDLSSPMNGPFKKQFGKTDYDIFTLMTVHSKKYARKLLLKYPKAGVFVPMGIGIYQKKGDNVLHLSILTAEAQAKIVGVKDVTIFKQIEKELQDALKKAIPNAKHSFSKDSLKEARNLVTTYELELDGEDFDDVFEEILMDLEAGFNPKGFVVPADLYVNDDIIAKDGKSTIYDIYYTTSICKLPVIYTVAKSRPEASAFAPCSTMVYKKKGEDKIVIGFPAVYNWLSSARVEDKKAKDVLLKAQKDFEAILKDITE